MFFPFQCSCSLVQQAQVCLPPDSDDAAKYAPVLYGYVCKTECRNDGPEFATVDAARGHRVLDALDDLGESCAAEQGLHAEEVRIEDGGEEGLIYANLHRQRKYLGTIVEIVSKPKKPLVGWNRTQSANDKRSTCASPVAVVAPLLHPSPLHILAPCSSGRFFRGRR